MESATTAPTDNPVPANSPVPANNAVDKLPVQQVATTAPPQQPRRKLKRSTRASLVVILILALVAGGMLATSYLIHASNYVSTDNAQVDGDKIVVNAPISGTLVDWNATQGAALSKGERVGRVEIQGGFLQPKMVIRAPANGTVAVDNGVPGGYVTAGSQLAVAYDLDKIFVTARVDETDIKGVRPGQRVDIKVDAFPNTQLSGYVREIQGGAAGRFALFPEANTSGNFQKVTQVIPVKIVVEDRRGLELVPGMNVSVNIHKRAGNTTIGAW